MHSTAQAMSGKARGVLSKPATRFAAVGVAVAAIGLPGAPAAAHGGGYPGGPTGTPEVSDPLISGLAGPLGLAVGRDRKVYVTQSFGGPVRSVTRNGEVADVVTDPDGPINGLAAAGGRLAYVVGKAGGPQAPASGFLKVLKRNGEVATLADLGGYEVANNPDSVNTYGFTDLDPACADQVPAEIGGGYPYQGQVDSNAYAVAQLPDGAWAVADAGGNDILRVGWDGAISVLAVLPPVPSEVTQEAATALGLPDCVVGHTYAFEPVPTDVEVGRDGKLYVTSLPGGPEDASLGARGGVFRVDKRGAVKRVATGLLGATDLAIDRHGTIYVTELFGNALSKIVRGAPVKVVELPSPAAVEYQGGDLYVTQDAFGAGSVVRVDLPKRGWWNWDD